VSYTLNQWDKLIAYLDCAELTPDNNISENAIRPFVVGRKNRLFYKSPTGAETACILYSVIETSKLNGLNPLKYLQALFERIPYAVSTDDWIVSPPPLEHLALIGGELTVTFFPSGKSNTDGPFW
jgi:transposase